MKTLIASLALLVASNALAQQTTYAYIGQPMAGLLGPTFNAMSAADYSMVAGTVTLAHNRSRATKQTRS